MADFRRRESVLYESARWAPPVNPIALCTAGVASWSLAFRRAYTRYGFQVPVTRSGWRLPQAWAWLGA